MTTYDEARNAGANHEEAKKIELLSHNKMLCRDGGLYAEKAGIPYNVWRNLCD
jgi:hypothetical protein